MRYASPVPMLVAFAFLEQRGLSAEAVIGRNIVALVRRHATDRIPAWLMVDMLERCAVQLDDPWFGLHYGQYLDPKTYGPISLLWRYAPSLRYSNRISRRILHLQHEGIMVAPLEDGESVTLVYRADAESGRDNRQFIESGVSFMLRVCRMLMGTNWTPQRVTFRHQPIGRPGQYAEILAAPVSFGADSDGLVLSREDFDRRSPEYNAEILGFVEQSLLRAAEQEPLPFRERLERVIDDLIAIHKPRLTAAAAAMAMSSRTLQRHLTAEGLTFRELVAARRRLIVDTWRQRSPKPSLALLAERTAYSEASALSRFLRA